MLEYGLISNSKLHQFIKINYCTNILLALMLMYIFAINRLGYYIGRVAFKEYIEQLK